MSVLFTDEAQRSELLRGRVKAKGNEEAAPPAPLYSKERRLKIVAEKRLLHDELEDESEYLVFAAREASLIASSFVVGDPATSRQLTADPWAPFSSLEALQPTVSSQATSDRIVDYLHAVKDEELQWANGDEVKEEKDSTGSSIVASRDDSLETLRLGAACKVANLILKGAEKGAKKDKSAQMGAQTRAEKDKAIEDIIEPFRPMPAEPELPTDALQDLRALCKAQLAANAQASALPLGAWVKQKDEKEVMENWTDEELLRSLNKGGKKVLRELLTRAEDWPRKDSLLLCLDKRKSVEKEPKEKLVHDLVQHLAVKKALGVRLPSILERLLSDGVGKDDQLLELLLMALLRAHLSITPVSKLPAPEVADLERQVKTRVDCAMQELLSELKVDDQTKTQNTGSLNTANSSLRVELKNRHLLSRCHVLSGIRTQAELAIRHAIVAAELTAKALADHEERSKDPALSVQDREAAAKADAGKVAAEATTAAASVAKAELLCVELQYVPPWMLHWVEPEDSVAWFAKEVAEGIRTKWLHSPAQAAQHSLNFAELKHLLRHEVLTKRVYDLGGKHLFLCPGTLGNERYTMDSNDEAPRPVLHLPAFEAVLTSKKWVHEDIQAWIRLACGDARVNLPDVTSSEWENSFREEWRDTAMRTAYCSVLKEMKTKLVSLPTSAPLPSQLRLLADLYELCDHMMAGTMGAKDRTNKTAHLPPYLVASVSIVLAHKLHEFAVPHLQIAVDKAARTSQKQSLACGQVPRPSKWDYPQYWRLVRNAVCHSQVVVGTKPAHSIVPHLTAQTHIKPRKHWVTLFNKAGTEINFAIHARADVILNAVCAARAHLLTRVCAMHDVW